MRYDTAKYSGDAEQFPTLNLLDDEQVLCVNKGEQPGTALFIEGCDEYFTVNLHAGQLRALAAELIRVADIVEQE